jgi:hypothetical protein
VNKVVTRLAQQYKVRRNRPKLDHRKRNYVMDVIARGAAPLTRPLVTFLDEPCYTFPLQRDIKQLAIRCTAALPVRIFVPDPTVHTILFAWTAPLLFFTNFGRSAASNLMLLQPKKYRRGCSTVLFGNIFRCALSVSILLL